MVVHKFQRVDGFHIEYTSLSTSIRKVVRIVRAFEDAVTEGVTESLLAIIVHMNSVGLVHRDVKVQTLVVVDCTIVHPLRISRSSIR